MRYQPDELFRSAAPFYARYRAGYPPECFGYLRDRFHLNGEQTVLDLGCGTGQVAIPLAPHVRRVVAVDPEPTMLDEGRRMAAEAGVTNVDWRLGDSYQLSSMDIPALDLVTMGASFHWMDRPAVLRDLDKMVKPGGCVVVASGGSPADGAAPTWEQIAADVRAKYLGSQRRAGSTTYTHPPQRHEEVLRESPFGDVEIVAWTWDLTRDLDSVVGLQFSYSFSAPAQFGGRRDDFERDLRTALTEAEPSGRFHQRIRTEAILAARPA
jgi:SAM-dependent methyltransferase